MMLASGFFDESGKFRDKKVICLGGVASYAHDFNRDFTFEWGRLIRLNGIKVFSAKKALNHRRKLGTNCDAIGIERRTDALLPFVECIRKYLQVVSGTVVDVDAYRGLPSHIHQMFTDDPVYMAFLRSMLQVVSFTALTIN